MLRAEIVGTAHPLPVRSRVRLRFERFLHALPLKPGGRAPPTASRSCRPATRFQRRVTTCPHRKTEKKPLASSACVPTRSAACRAVMAGWAGEGGGRFGERREYEAPTLPSTHRQHGMARHYKSQARNSTLQQHSAVRHHTCQPSNGTPPKSPNTGPIKARPPNPISIGYE